MSMRKIFTCDICRTDKKASELIGVCFKHGGKFLLSESNSTDGVHICDICAKQLREQLTNKEAQRQPPADVFERKANDE